MLKRYNELSQANRMILVLLAIFIGFSGVVGAAVFLNEEGVFNSSDDSTDELSFDTFGSCRELTNHVNSNLENGFPVEPFFFEDEIAFSEEAGQDLAVRADTPSGTTNRDFSETNIQVEGVDEADVVKTDGSYIYLANDNVVTVVDVTDLSNPTELTTIEAPGNPIEMFLIDNYLVVLTNDYIFYNFAETSRFFDYWPLDETETALLVYDISDPSEPELKRDIKVEGDYNTARLTDGTVYLITSKYFYPETNSSVEEIATEIPELNDNSSDEGYQPGAECNEIAHFGDSVNSFLMITALDLEDESRETDVILGDAGNVYMSRRNIYLATTVLENGEEEVRGDTISIERAPSNQETAIFKLSVNKTDVNFDSIGEVPGTLINRFAMDEYDGDLRVATTKDDFTGFNTRDNNLYILDQDMNRLGEVTGLANGERIFAVRFIGERGYVVTFRQVDPLFVFDLSDPSNPTLEGELKIPGFSDYLHPFDENHIIGIGKDADESSGIAEGLKVALFDVRDANNPIEKDSLIIGERGSDSIALREPKAFLFDREKELMVIPADLYETIDGVNSPFGDLTFSGFLVFDINLDEITLRERLGSDEPRNNWYWNPNSRSLYIEDDLFTFANNELKSYDLGTLEEKNSLDI